MKYCKDCMIINFLGEKRKEFKIKMSIPDMAKLGKSLGILHIIDNKKYLITIKFDEVEEGDKNDDRHQKSKRNNKVPNHNEPEPITDAR